MKFLIILCLSFFMFLTGCSSSSNPNQVILDNAPIIETTSSLATTATLLAIKEQDRANVAKIIYDVSNAINLVAKDQTDLSGVTAIADAYLNKWNSQYRPVVTALLNNGMGMAQNYLNNYFSNQTPSVKLQALRSFLYYTSKGMETGALAYTHATPVTPVIKMKVSAQNNKVVVVIHDWLEN